MPNKHAQVSLPPDEELKRLPPDEVLSPLIDDWARAGKRLAIVCDIDLDRFAEVNQRLGMAGGNAALVEAARRIKAQLPRESVMARIGGDEFGAVFAGLGFPQCHEVLERILLALAEPWEWRGLTANLGGSLGARLMDSTGPAPEIALRDAQHAAFFAKRAADGKVHYFDAPQAKADAQVVRQRQRIQEGLAQDEFFLEYQPKVDMRRGVVVGAEALIRWRHPERGLLQPIHFVPLLEDEMLAEQVGQWVIGTALRQLYDWREAGLRMSVSVNVSPLHMMRHDFVDRLTEQLAQYPKLGAGALELEILETTAISQFATVARFVEACRALGVAVAIDDFGTGYSSLTYLRQLPVSSVKIDQSFIREMLDSEPDRAIVQGILLLLKALGRTAVAEGVETPAHGEALLAMGCTLAQGYGIAKPMAADQMQRWVAGFERAPPWGRKEPPQGSQAAPAAPGSAPSAPPPQSSGV
ncbi:diguanylate cyclase (GGDEF)-like protein [Variovorax boronicumulans]|uniref:Diguanylate cyclase (GGDEF)-like protein n=1 Tax=Variovorax boronicumulans TaxID=436515 RepID=A0AAW8D0T7_9BURK|nr:bifunctional diguanylate cyclase/phosphodiesterase [Variovorax boronicumulans]MDP9896170.1 diguanylate cyclase (GGDEF)-like protein [Variovorax boronicumulans]MDQ0056217.1 diguanylate cyclase (GGDEF)-like protein [Variovorax boronicumulans]